jgi:hypothetical protein
MHSNHEIARLLLRHEAELHVHSILNGKIEDWGTAPGSTPLHFAAATGSREMIDILLGAQVARLGARLERMVNSGMPPPSIDPRMLVNSIGQAPYHIAKNCRFDYLLEVLNPMMPLSDFFTGARSELLCAYGVLPLSTLAAAALQRHLLNHLDSIEQQELYKQRQEAQQEAQQQRRQQKKLVDAVTALPRPSSQDADAGEATACIVITTRWQDKEQQRQQQQGGSSKEAAPPSAGLSSTPSAAKVPPAPASASADDVAAAGALTGLAGILSTVSSISDNACSICLEEAPLVSISSCKHTLCAGCARELCKRRALRPAACPMCRDVIPGFEL